MEQCNSVPKGAWRAPKDTQRSDRNGVCQLPGAAQLTGSVSVRFLSDFCQISNELSVGCMLGLDNPSIIGMKRVAAMFYAYHAVSLHPVARSLQSVESCQQIPTTDFQLFQQIFAGSFEAALKHAC